MSEQTPHIQRTLTQLQQDLFDRSARNPLVQVNLDKLWFLDDEPDVKKPTHIYQKARFFEKEYGLETALLVSHFVRWKKPGEPLFYTSPLLCKSVIITAKKREGITYSISEKETPAFINPVLRKLFLEIFDLQLPAFIDTPESILELLSREFKEFTLQTGFKIEDRWQIISKRAVGIFNYKKLMLARDYETIKLNPGKTLHHLFGEYDKTDATQPQPFIADVLDPSQKEAVQHALENHTVIQGPPGTGKSQTIVALIKTLLAQNKKVLFVSEKRSALEVVFQRLQKENLDSQIAFFNPDKDEKKQLYQQLKKVWERGVEHRSKTHSEATFSSVSKAASSYYPWQLLKTDPNTGTSIQQLLNKLIKNGFNPSELSASDYYPPYAIWQKEVEKLRELEAFILNAFGVNNLAGAAFILLNSAVFSEPEPVQKLARRIAQLEQSLEKIRVLSARYRLTDHPDAFLRIAIAASILSMVNKNQLDLLQKDHKKFKAFSTLAKKYQLIKNKLEQAEQINLKWSKKPSISEITSLTDQLKQQKKPRSILGILKRNSARSKDFFADFSPALSTVAKLQLLEEIRAEWHLRGELEALKIKLKHELNILNPDTEIDHILNVRSRLNAVSQNEYITLLEHPESVDLIKDLAGIHQTVNHSSGLVSYLFSQPDFNSFAALKDQLQLLKDQLELMDRFHQELTVFFKIPGPILNFIRTQKSDIQTLDLRITWKQLSDQARFEPAFKKLNGAALFSDFQDQLEFLKKVNLDTVSTIQNHSVHYLANAEKLAETPASKLQEETKKNKQKFKEARRVLIHEFTKKQQHLPVIELMQHHAETVLALLPVWMMNPLSVAQFLPCAEALFDYIIFDEASQIPLEDAIPAIYRGARLVVAGDSQQMPPGHFFTSNPDGKTLLDQAEYHFKNVMLNSHYRSEHPNLIACSNKHFYDFELTALPPVHAENPVQLIRLNGIFEDHKNTLEAEAIANHYKVLLQQGKTDVGIIAFSKEQQSEIEKKLAALGLPENEHLAVRNLENVQGIEKQIILISIGYAKNNEGVFRKNFGPVNRDRGANRLNVLFTRAIQKMIIFSSITSADFELSENRGTSVLADFLKHAENQTTKNTTPKIQAPLHLQIYELLMNNNIDFAYYSPEDGVSIACFVQHATGSILLADPCTLPNETTDLFSLLHALSKRFTKIKIVTSNEFLQHKKSLQDELIRFFKL